MWKRSAFGAHLKRIREKRLGMRIREAAEAAGIAYPYLSEIENGKKIPRPRVIAKLAGVYGVSTFELLMKSGYINRLLGTRHQNYFLEDLNILFKDSSFVSGFRDWMMETNETLTQPELYRRDKEDDELLQRGELSERTERYFRTALYDMRLASSVPTMNVADRIPTAAKGMIAELYRWYSRTEPLSREQ